MGVSTGTVSHILERAVAGLSWPLPDGLDDDELASAPGSSRPESRSNHAGIPVKCPRNRRQVRRNPQMPSSLLETAGLSRQKRARVAQFSRRGVWFDAVTCR